jgi:hypothetical protein
VVTTVSTQPTASVARAWVPYPCVTVDVLVYGGARVPSRVAAVSWRRGEHDVMHPHASASIQGKEYNQIRCRKSDDISGDVGARRQGRTEPAMAT